MSKSLMLGTARAKLLRQPDADMAQIVENRLLTKPGTPEKRHISAFLFNAIFDDVC